MATMRIAERVRIDNGTVVKTTNLIRCGTCGEPVTMRHGNRRDSWRHGMPDGDITVLA